MICTNLVRAKIEELELKNKDIAEKLGLAESSWYMKLSGARSLTIKEMFELQKILKLQDDELKTFFLN